MAACSPPPNCGAKTGVLLGQQQTGAKRAFLQRPDSHRRVRIRWSLKCRDFSVHALQISRQRSQPRLNLSRDRHTRRRRTKQPSDGPLIRLAPTTPPSRETTPGIQNTALAVVRDPLPRRRATASGNVINKRRVDIIDGLLPVLLSAIAQRPVRVAVRLVLPGRYVGHLQPKLLIQTRLIDVHAIHPTRPRIAGWRDHTLISLRPNPVRRRPNQRARDRHNRLSTTRLPDMLSRLRDKINEATRGIHIDDDPLNLRIRNRLIKRLPKPEQATRRTTEQEVQKRALRRNDPGQRDNSHPACRLLRSPTVAANQRKARTLRKASGTHDRREHVLPDRPRRPRQQQRRNTRSCGTS